MKRKHVSLKAITTLWLLSAVVFAQSAPAKPRPRHKTVAARASAEQAEIEALHNLVAAQQQQLQTQQQQLEQFKSQLQQVLEATQQANAALQKAQQGTSEAQAAAGQAQNSASEAQRAADEASANAVEAKTGLSLISSKQKDEEKQVSALRDILGRFRFSGDVRVRGEDFFQEGVITRNRARIRVRFGLEGKLNESFVGGFALATGSLGDPTTTNETFTNNFDRKTIGLDRGYVTFNPTGAKWLSLTGGKFAFPWQRTSLTFDPDINPEGFNEKFSFDLNSPVLKTFTVQGIQLLYNEVSKGDDSFGLGGQVSGVVKLGPLTTTPSFLLLDWRFVDALLNASTFATQAGGEGPGCSTGVLLPSTAPCAFAANGMTNATYQDASGKSHFLSGFEYADFILNNQIDTGSKRLPLNLVLEIEDNLKAASHPLSTSGAALASLGSQSKGYLGEISLGQSKSKGDLQFGYSYWRLEQDAILASWAESDERAPTNVLQQRIYAMWRPQARVTAQYTLWFGRTLNSSLEHAVLATGVAPGEVEPNLRRQEFDLIYSF
ncbi:MAG TPA: putative porin [Terriglobales bacterium]|nr:putative porin [Terriglobales bacterium]